MREALDPQPGDRVLEIGPGPATTPSTRPIGSGAKRRSDILDLQQEMLDHTMRRYTVLTT